MSANWCVNEERIRYPPQPWHLSGQLYASLWRVPASAVPAPLPDSLQTVSAFGRTFVVTAVAHYEPGGVLTYNEMLLAIRVRLQGRMFTHVPLIWVDDLSSAVGARALWSIPKRLAAFAIEDTSSAMDMKADGQTLASMEFQSRLRLPGVGPYELASCIPLVRR